jgi:hypothetical protein
LGEAGSVIFFSYILAFALQLRKSTENLSHGSWLVFHQTSRKALPFWTAQSYSALKRLTVFRSALERASPVGREEAFERRRGGQLNAGLGGKVLEVS